MPTTSEVRAKIAADRTTPDAERGVDNRDPDSLPRDMKLATERPPLNQKSLRVLPLALAALVGVLGTIALLMMLG